MDIAEQDDQPVEQVGLPAPQAFDSSGPKTMLKAAGIALAILALTALVVSFVPEQNTGPLANGVGGLWNLFLKLVTGAIWAAGGIGAIGSLLFGANLWGHARVRNAQAARQAAGLPVGPPRREPGLDLAVGASMMFSSIFMLNEYLLFGLLITGAVIVLISIVRIGRNLLAPDSHV